MAEQPVFLLHVSAKFYIRIAAAGKHGHEQVSRIDDTGYRVRDRQCSTRPINLHGVTGLVMNPHRCFGPLRPCTINVAKLRVLIRNAASIGTFDLIFIVKQGQVYAFLRKFRMDVCAIRFHVHLCFVKPLRIKQLIKPLVRESLF